MVTGSCLCGAVRYETSAAPASTTHCHCSMCRKAHGAAFATFVGLPREGLRVSGEEHLRRYRSSEPVLRGFCEVCGSSLTFEDERYPEAIWVAAGTLDGDPPLPAAVHIYVASKAPWHAITDDLPQRAEM